MSELAEGILEGIPTGLNEYNVTMSNQLIRSSHSLSLVEKRCIAAIIAKVDSRRGNSLHAHLSEYKTIKLTAADYSETYDIDQKTAYRDLKTAADRLFERRVSIKEYDNKKHEKTTKFRWVSSVSYVSELGYVELSFTKEIYPHLNALGREFRQYKLKNASSFRSIYTWRLFEYANSWLEYCTSKQKPIIVTVDNIRDMLDVPKSYSYKDFRVRALVPAIEETEKKSNIEITFKPIKKGRSYHSLSLFVKSKDQLELSLDECDDVKEITSECDDFEGLISEFDDFILSKASV
jgi:plasmid replication initiation protein